MATYLGTAAVFEVRSGATAGNVNGGGFNPANANFISNFTATSATGNSPVISSASYNFVAGDVGAWIYVKSGTNWTPGWYQIASVGANAATVNAAIGAAIQISNNRYITNTVAGCATTASPTSGTCGIDYSQQNSAQVTNSVLTGTTTACTDATTPFAAQHVGNFICISTGTGVTAGWYEIVSVSAGTATLDRSAGASYSSCTYYLGGAVSLGGSTTGITDVIFFALGASAATAGCRFFIKNGSYTPAQASTTVAGSATWPSIVEGYNSLRGDRPSIASGNQPSFTVGAAQFTVGASSQCWCITFLSSTGTSPLKGSNISAIINCKVKCMSTGAAITGTSGNTQVIGCELISYGGNGVLCGGSAMFIAGCYIHDCNIGINFNGAASGNVVVNNIISSSATQAINDAIGSNFIYGNTIYGAENKLGIGIASPFFSNTTINNIFYGLTSGYGVSGTQNIGIADYNCFFNNTNNIAGATTGAYLGANDLTAVNPAFTSVAQVTGTGASTATTTLTDGGKNFTTAGVVAGRDYVNIISSSGITNGIYGISVVGTTTLTLDKSPGTTGTSVTYQITTGSNFLPTGAI